MVAPARATSRRVNGTHFSPRTISYIDDNKRRNICGKAPLLPGQNRLWLPPPCPPETDECRIILICTCSETPLRTGGRDRRLPGLRGRNLLG